MPRPRSDPDLSSFGIVLMCGGLLRWMLKGEERKGGGVNFQKLHPSLSLPNRSEVLVQPVLDFLVDLFAELRPHTVAGIVSHPLFV